MKSPVPGEWLRDFWKMFGRVPELIAIVVGLALWFWMLARVV